MSFVGEIIASIAKKGESFQSPVVGKMELLIIQSDKARVEVCQALSSRYELLSSALHDTSMLKQQVDKCLDDITYLEKEIQEEVLVNVESSIGELGTVTARWKAVTSELTAVKTLLTIHNHFEESQKSLLIEHFYEAAQSLFKVERLLPEFSTKDIEGQLAIIVPLREELTLKTNHVLYSAGEVWRKYIKWSDEPGANGSPSSSLIISNVDVNDGYVLIREMVDALCSMGELKRYLRHFGSKFMEYIVRPIVCSNADVTIERRGDSVMLQSNVPKKSSLKKNAPEILSHLKIVLKFLHEVFFHVKLKCDNDEGSLMFLLGKEIGDDFLKLILKECLADSVPCNRKDLKEFEQSLQTATNDFQGFLISIDFYREGRISLLDYAANVEVVFSNKACADLLSKARRLMLQPLHVTAAIAPLSPGEPLVVLNESGELLEKSTNNMKKIHLVETFNLPKCKVSASTCDLINLIYDILEEACRSTPEYAGRLFYIVRNILTLYCSVVPSAHGHTIDTIPQYAALVHNNSMLLSHHCLLLGHLYKNRLPEALRDRTLTTTDLAVLLRNSASEIFLKAMRSHKSSLLEALKDGFGSPTLGCESATALEAEQGVKQCIDQLHRLHAVWQNVLPYSVYVKSMGTLCGSVVEEVVGRIVSLQDISADSALLLIVTLNILKENVPPLFKVDDELDASEGDVVREVKLWGKMAELIIVLEMSLKELLDRWLGGKGPFAMYFTPDEAKQLIRALFQNTEKRAEVLAKIK